METILLGISPQFFVSASCLVLTHRWWSLWLWKSCRGWIAGFRGRRISTLGHWSFAASEAPIWPFGWIPKCLLLNLLPNDEMAVGIISSMKWRNESIYLYLDYYGFIWVVTLCFVLSDWAKKSPLCWNFLRVLFLSALKLCLYPAS